MQSQINIAFRNPCRTSFLAIREMSKSKKSKNSLPEQQTEPEKPVNVDKSGNICIKVWAKPGAKSNLITSIDEDGVGIQINAKPVDGEANSELLSYLSSILQLKKSNISLDKGSKSRQKVVLVSSKDCTVDDILKRLKNEMANNKG